MFSSKNACHFFKVGFQKLAPFLFHQFQFNPVMDIQIINWQQSNDNDVSYLVLRKPINNPNPDLDMNMTHAYNIMEPANSNLLTYWLSGVFGEAIIKSSGGVCGEKAGKKSCAIIKSSGGVCGEKVGKPPGGVGGVLGTIIITSSGVLAFNSGPSHTSGVDGFDGLCDMGVLSPGSLSRPSNLRGERLRSRG